MKTVSDLYKWRDEVFNDPRLKDIAKEMATKVLALVPDNLSAEERDIYGDILLQAFKADFELRYMVEIA